MWIWIILLLLVPALIALLLFERFKGYSYSLMKRLALLSIFAFLINMFVYAIIWIRGWHYFDWSGLPETSLTGTFVVLQYMVMSLVVAVGLAYVLSLVRIKKREENDETPTEDDINTD
ncbi:MAG: hypothetical protein LBC73_00165 [Oscillospiraceae bacterium]|jgi:predicted Na+-dependent transporter|nr:hypothetical protein [Oscillospiraceae bacterium]